jgi:heme exporter protein CcmD
MTDFSTFAAMSGYGMYVWPAYGLALIAYGAVFIHALIKKDRLKKKQQGEK